MIGVSIAIVKLEVGMSENYFILDGVVVSIITNNLVDMESVKSIIVDIWSELPEMIIRRWSRRERFTFVIEKENYALQNMGYSQILLTPHMIVRPDYIVHQLIHTLYCIPVPFINEGIAIYAQYHWAPVLSPPFFGASLLETVTKSLTPENMEILNSVSSKWAIGNCNGIQGCVLWRNTRNTYPYLIAGAFIEYLAKLVPASRLVSVWDILNYHGILEDERFHTAWECFGATFDELLVRWRDTVVNTFGIEQMASA